MKPLTHYTIDSHLMHTIVRYLELKPAGETRGLLNTIEVACRKQEEEHRIAFWFAPPYQLDLDETAPAATP